MYNPNQRRGLYQKSMTRKLSSHAKHKRLAQLDPKGMNRYLNDFLAWCEMMGRTKETCRSYYYDLYTFIGWCDDRALTEPTDLSFDLLFLYQKHLYEYSKADGTPLSSSTQNRKLCSIKVLFRWFFKQKLIPFNPASEIELPKVVKSLPKHVLSLEEMKRILNLPDVQTPYGIRDRAMIETLYSTGCRRSELSNLTIDCIDLSRKTLLIIKGKNQKDRVLPLNKSTLKWINLYMQQVRPTLTSGYETTLFLTDYGQIFTKNRLTELVKKYLYHASVTKAGGCHLFRHAMATHMLDNGADIRHIQEMLGHSHLSTTQIYTKVSIEKLREVHQATHPSS